MRISDDSRDWTELSYLRDGNPVQAEVYALLTRHRVMEKLEAYGPVLVGTVPIGIQTAGSDLDLICSVSDFERFHADVQAIFGQEDGYAYRIGSSGGSRHATANFMLDGWPIEIYGERKPAREQNGYRHMLIEARLLELLGGSFRRRIMRLKLEGVKTEPAFARILQLQGDPYGALLDLETWSDERLRALISKNL